jgi:hypothetical protein
MTLSMTGAPPGRGRHPGGAAALQAEVGDWLVMDDGGIGGIPRIGEIVAVTNPDGSPPYRVRWLAGEYESLITPGPGARVEKARLPPVRAAGIRGPGLPRAVRRERRDARPDR